MGQFFFRKGRSTNDITALMKTTFEAEQRKNQHSKGVMLAAIEVFNAFNSVDWKNMFGPLREKFEAPPYIFRMVEDYLKVRHHLFDTKDGIKSRRVTAGAAQGSILGPVLWKIFYDDILRFEIPNGCYLVGYEDDMAIMITERSLDEFQDKLVILRIRRWHEEERQT